MNIKQAIDSLAVNNDDHWTADGLPRVDAVIDILGYEITRKQITDVSQRVRGESVTPIGTPEDEEKRKQEAALAAVPPSTTDEPQPEPEKPAEPSESPQEEDDASEVEPEDDVVAMNVTKVHSNLELIERAQKEFSRQASILSKRHEAIKKKLIDIGRRSALLEKSKNILLRGKPVNQQQPAISRYLETQNKARAKRVKAAQAFISAGTNAEDVRRQLAGPSILDAAMRAKRQRGTVRPAYPKVGSDK